MKEKTTKRDKEYLFEYNQSIGNFILKKLFTYKESLFFNTLLFGPIFLLIIGLYEGTYVPVFILFISLIMLIIWMIKSHIPVVLLKKKAVYISLTKDTLVWETPYDSFNLNISDIEEIILQKTIIEVHAYPNLLFLPWHIISNGWRSVDFDKQKRREHIISDYYIVTNKKVNHLSIDLYIPNKKLIDSLSSIGIETKTYKKTIEQSYELLHDRYVRGRSREALKLYEYTREDNHIIKSSVK